MIIGVIYFDFCSFKSYELDKLTKNTLFSYLHTYFFWLDMKKENKLRIWSTITIFYTNFKSLTWDEHVKPISKSTEQVFLLQKFVFALEFKTMVQHLFIYSNCPCLPIICRVILFHYPNPKYKIVQFPSLVFSTCRVDIKSFFFLIIKIDIKQFADLDSISITVSE